MAIHPRASEQYGGFQQPGSCYYSCDSSFLGSNQWNLPSCLTKGFLFGFFAADGFIECLFARRPPRPEDFPRLFLKSPKWPGTLVNRGSCIRPLAFSHGPPDLFGSPVVSLQKAKEPITWIQESPFRNPLKQVALNWARCKWRYCICPRRLVSWPEENYSQLLSVAWAACE